MNKRANTAGTIGAHAGVSALLGSLPATVEYAYYRQFATDQTREARRKALIRAMAKWMSVGAGVGTVKGIIEVSRSRQHDSPQNKTEAPPDDDYSEYLRQWSPPNLVNNPYLVQV